MARPIQVSPAKAGAIQATRRKYNLSQERLAWIFGINSKTVASILTNPERYITEPKKGEK